MEQEDDQRESGAADDAEEDGLPVRIIVSVQGQGGVTLSRVSRD